MGSGVIGFFSYSLFLCCDPQHGCQAEQQHSQLAPHLHNNWRLHGRSVESQTQILRGCALMLLKKSILRIT